jgi:putative ABC transport system substrate-binding protein
VAVLWNSARHYLYVELALREVNAAARVLGVQLQVREARGPDQFEPAFAAMVRGQADALLTFEDSMSWLHRRRLCRQDPQTRKARRPARGAAYEGRGGRVAAARR